MMFPLVPLPSFLITLIPWLLEMHTIGAWIGAVGFASGGLVVLMLWVPGYNGSRTSRESVKSGFLLLATAVLFLLAGLYLWTLFCIGFALFSAWVLGQGVVILFKG